MAVYEKIFLKFSQNFVSKAQLKKNSHKQPFQNYFLISQNGMLFIHHGEGNVLHLCVILFMGGCAWLGGVYGWGCMAGGCMVGVCVAGGCAWFGVHGWNHARPSPDGWQAGGMHPTGMLTCSGYF